MLVASLDEFPIDKKCEELLDLTRKRQEVIDNDEMIMDYAHEVDEKQMKLPKMPKEIEEKIERDNSIISERSETLTRAVTGMITSPLSKRVQVQKTQKIKKELPKLDFDSVISNELSPEEKEEAFLDFYTYLVVDMSCAMKIIDKKKYRYGCMSRDNEKLPNGVFKIVDRLMRIKESCLTMMWNKQVGSYLESHTVMRGTTVMKQQELCALCGKSVQKDKMIEVHLGGVTYDSENIDSGKFKKLVSLFEEMKKENNNENIKSLVFGKFCFKKAKLYHSVYHFVFNLLHEIYTIQCGSDNRLFEIRDGRVIVPKGSLFTASYTKFLSLNDDVGRCLKLK